MSLLIRYWPALVGALAVMGLVWWHNSAVSDAYDRGKVEQAAADTEAFRAAQDAAAAEQQALIDATAANAAKISKRTEDAITKDRDAIARSYDDLRRMWAAHRADPGRAGQNGASGLAGAAAVPDDAYCPSQGWVSLDVAAAAAEAADEAIAKDDAWRSWWQEQEAAWPR